MKLIDTHAHLDRYIKNDSLKDVIKRAKEADIKAIITCSTCPEDWELYARMSAFEPIIFWQAGIHPTEISQNDLDAIPYLEKLFSTLRPKKLVAMGEIGLDFYRLPKDDEELCAKIVASQYEILRRQLDIAVRHNLKVCIHARSAIQESIEEIIKSGLNFENVVFHCFSGTVDELSQINALGARASFTGIISYANAEEMRQAMLEQGLDKLMLETDCPYLAPTPHRGKENEPAYMREIAKCAAKIFKLEPEELANITTLNSERFFSISYD